MNLGLWCVRFKEEVPREKGESEPDCEQERTSLYCVNVHVVNL